MMNKHSQAIMLLLVCLLLAACFRHQNEAVDVKEGGADSKPELRNSGSELRKPTGQEGPAGQSSGTAGNKYERLQGYTFLVPDKWEVVPPEHFRDVPNRWEAVPYLDILYMVYGDQNHTKVRFCFQTGLKDKRYIETNPFEQFDEIDEKQFEQGLRERLQVDTVNLVENKHMKVNGFDVLWLRFTYSSPREKGDVIMKLLYKDGSAFSITGTFSSPMYWELQKDIAAVLESIRKE